MDSASSWPAVKLLTCIWAEAIEAYANEQRLLYLANSQSEEAVRLFAEYYSISPLIVKKPISTPARSRSSAKTIDPAAVLKPIFKYDAMVHQIQQYHVNGNSLYRGLIITYKIDMVIQDVTHLIVQIVIPSLALRGIFDHGYLAKTKKQIQSDKQQSFRLAICGFWRQRNLRLSSSEPADSHSCYTKDIQTLITTGVLYKCTEGGDDQFVDPNGIIAVTPPFFTQITNRLIQALRSHQIRMRGANGTHAKLSVIDGVEWAFVEHNLRSSITASISNARDDLVSPISGRIQTARTPILLLPCPNSFELAHDIPGNFRGKIEDNSLVVGIKCTTEPAVDVCQLPVFDHNDTQNGSEQPEDKCPPTEITDDSLSKPIVELQEAAGLPKEDAGNHPLPQNDCFRTRTDDFSGEQKSPHVDHTCRRPLYNCGRKDDHTEQSVASLSDLCCESTRLVVIEAIKTACITDYLDIVCGITSRIADKISPFQPELVKVEYVNVPLDNSAKQQSTTMALTNVVSPEFQDLVFNDTNSNRFIDSSVFSGIAEGRRFTRVASLNGCEYLNIKSSKRLVPSTMMSERETTINDLLTKVMHIAEDAAASHLPNRLIRRFDSNCLLTNVAVANASCYKRHSDTAILNYEDCYICNRSDHVIAMLQLVGDNKNIQDRVSEPITSVEDDNQIATDNAPCLCECGNVMTRLSSLPNDNEMCVPTFTGTPDVSHAELATHVATLNMYGRHGCDRRPPQRLKLFANTIHLQLWGSQLGTHEVEWNKHSSATVRMVASARNLLCPICDHIKFAVATRNHQLVRPSMSEADSIYKHSSVIDCLRHGKQPSIQNSAPLPGGDDPVVLPIEPSNGVVKQRIYREDKVRYEVDHEGISDDDKIPFPSEYIASNGKTKYHFLAEMTGISELHKRKLAVVCTRNNDGNSNTVISTGQQSIIGHAPAMACYRSYGDTRNPTADNPVRQSVPRRRLITGDLVAKTELLSVLGISGSQTRQKHTWGEEIVSAKGTRALLLYALYKNDFAAVVHLQDQIRDYISKTLHGEIHNDSTAPYDQTSCETRIDIYGSGGNAMSTGNFAIDSRKLDVVKPAATINSPIHQTVLERGSKKNIYLTEAALNKYVLMVFAPCKEDLCCKERRKKPTFMQFLGQFYVEQCVHGVQESEADINRYVEKLNSLIGPLTVEEEFNLSYRSEPHIKATVRRMSDPVPIDNGGYTFASVDESTLSETVEIPMPEGMAKSQAFRLGRGMLSPSIIRHRMLASVIDEITETTADDTSVNAYCSKASYETSTTTEGHLDPKSPWDILCASRKRERICFSPQDFAIVMQHLFVGCSIRALDNTVQINNGMSTILHGSIEHGSNLADFVRAFPMPSPIRTYDKITSYFLTMAKNSMSCLAESKGRVIDPGLAVADDLSRLVLTSFLLRLTGRVDMWHEYQVWCHSTLSGGSTDGAMLQDSLISEIQVGRFMEFVQSTVIKGNPEGSVSNWISDQFSSSLPAAVKQTYSRFRQFALSVVCGFPSFIKQLIGLIHSPEPSRNEAVSALDQLLSVHWGGERSDSTVRHRSFFAHMIISDIEEVYSLPFGHCSEVPYGYGAMQGFQLMEALDALPDQKKRKKSATEGHTMPGDFLSLYLDYLQNMSAGRASMIGLERKTMPDGSEQLVVGYNNRIVGLVDIEHMACKLHIALSRTRGTRAFSKPTAVPFCCYPFRYQTLYPQEMRKWFAIAVDTHRSSCYDDEWKEVPDALSMKTLKRDLRQPNVTVPPSAATNSTSQGMFGEDEDHDGDNDSDNDSDYYPTTNMNVLEKNDLTSVEQRSPIHRSAIDTKTNSRVLLVLRGISETLQQRTRNSIIDNETEKSQFWNDVSLQLGMPHPKENIEQVFGVFDRQLDSTIDNGTITDRFIISHPLFASDRQKGLMRRLGIVSGYATSEPSTGGYLEEVRHILFPDTIKKHQGFSTVSNGGDNIRFRRMDKWDSMGKDHINVLLRPIISKMKEDASFLWSEKTGKQHLPSDVMFRASCILSEMTTTSRSSDSHPQSAHCDYDRKSQARGTSTNHAKPISVFCPLSEDGMMLQIWTDDLETAVMVYVPYGTMLYMDGDVFHAGGFCFGSGCNERLHFYVVSSDDRYTFGMIEDGNIYTPRKMKHSVNEKLSEGVCPVQMEKVKKSLLWNIS